MFVRISNAPRDYAWGSTTAISGLLGTDPSGGPEAELWLGAHPGSPSRVLDPASVGGAHDLGEWIAASPSVALGAHPRLPFLLKVLAAASPLSLQAHPSEAQAQAGFERENALGITLDAPHRNYKDPYSKPEIIYALSDAFDALCGFRRLEESRELLTALGLSDVAERLDSEESLKSVVEWLITRGDGVDELIARVVAVAAGSDDPFPKTKDIRPESVHDGAERLESGRNSFVLDAIDTVRMLAEQYPGDPGIVISLLLNRVTLKRGEALYLPAGNIHAYLRGLGIELMTASDNVLRGGLTPKHVDVPELLAVLEFSPVVVPYLAPEATPDGTTVFHPDGPGFSLVHIQGDATHELTGPAIVLCTAGSFSIDGAGASVNLDRGDAVYITPDEAGLSFAGVGELFLATTD